MPPAKKQPGTQKKAAPKNAAAKSATAQKPSAKRRASKTVKTPPPSANLEHLTGERARLRLPSLRREREALEKLAHAMVDLPGVYSVEANPLTAGILIRYQGDFGAISKGALEAGLFVIEDPQPGPDVMNGLRGRMRNVEAMLRRGSAGSIDVNTAAFLFFSLVAMVQLARGRIAMPAFSALWYALNSLRSASFEEPDDKGAPRK